MPLKRKGKCFLCGKHNVPLCMHCGFVHTCKLHFLLHYQNDYCFPFKVTSHGFTASRDIQPLELIWFERPLAFGPKLYEFSKVCADCLKANPSNLCSLCDLPICNDACQMGHNHYIECQILRNGRNILKNQVEMKQKSILPIRILSSQDVSETAYKRTKLLHENIELLEDSDEKVVNLIKSLTNAELGQIRWAMALGRRKSVNTHDNQGSVFYPLFSLVEHSCSANAKFLVYANHCIAMQAQNHISAGDDIRVSYVPALEPTWKRRAMLYRSVVSIFSNHLDHGFMIIFSKQD